LLKLSHVALSVSDLDTSVVFYSKIFGFSPVEKFQDQSSDLTVCLLKKDDITLELFKFKEYSPLPQYRKNLDSDLKTLGAKHFAFEVDTIEIWYEKLKSANVTFVTDVCTLENGAKYFFIKDPDGILVEVIEKEGPR
jgi:catechol 2,3-dioxygenase-like lactoylglutathione lyase family enzyme